ncbi:Dps family protein [Paenibacillus cisolokensis]|uniref:Dps family protein n=1 Tax=Paenibacillus cisolokensis TaxID=1658519 RepID=UPI003D2A7389
MTTIHEALNRQIANWSVLYIKLHHYHWYVKGSQFFTLHAKFQELYEEAALRVDELAERLIAIGGRPVSRMKQFLETATVKEAEGNETAEQMVDALIADYSLMIGELQDATAIAERQGDERTADMLVDIQKGLENHVWMLKAFNGR